MMPAGGATAEIDVDADSLSSEDAEYPEAGPGWGIEVTEPSPFQICQVLLPSSRF